MEPLERYLLAGLLLLLGCNSAKDNRVAHTDSSSSWTYVIVKANGHEFSVSTYDDTLTFKKARTGRMDTLQKVKMLKSEKDSLFKWTEALIQTKPEPINYCTDYFGKLTLRIIYSEQVSRQVDYRSICEWQSLDSNTSNLYKLLNGKLNRRLKP